ncbi:MAG: hypothetical protein K2I74_06665 [Treponemataceae bacterium]|nr:hypothetical protein [Treponemataceae bacterium]
MKIEMGESLLRSYFKDIKGCLITQTNWKVSENWKTDSADSAQLQDIYKKIRSDSDFSDVFKTELAQTLRQAEVDVIGIDAGGKVYMAEVAFHEGGLNYGGKNETKDRVVKKLLRAYLAATKFFPGHAYEILFASPKVNPATDEIIKAYFSMLSDHFESNAVHFAYYANDDFRDEILVPTYRRTKAEADTSDLFIRSVRMLDMFALVNEEQTPLARKGAAGKKHQPSDNAPEIVYTIGERTVDAGTFKEELLRIKSARRIWQYADGRTETDIWDASKKFTHESSLTGNIHSTTKFRNWKDNGLVRLILTL